MKKFILLFGMFFTLQVGAVAVTGYDGKRIEIENPKRIVSLNSTTTEILFALGKKDLVVGVDSSGLLIAGAEKLPNLGHPYRPSVEGIISLNPELVIATVESLPEASLLQLRGAKVPVLILESSFENGSSGLVKRIKMIASAVNEDEKGEALVEKLNTELRVLENKVKKVTDKKKVFFLYTHGPGSANIYGKNTGTHLLIEAAGAKNAADFTIGTKPLTSEAMVVSAPDSIIMLGRGLDAVGGIEGALKLPGVSLTAAGKAKRIFQVDDSVRWIGIRFPQFATELFENIYGNE